MGPASNDIPYEGQGDTWRTGGHRKKEAKDGVTQPQAREHLESPEGTRGKKGLPRTAVANPQAMDGYWSLACQDLIAEQEVSGG